MQATQRLPQPRRRSFSPAFLSQLLSHAVLLTMSVLAIFPFVWMVAASFKTFKELVSSKDLLPHVWTVNNYREIVSRVNFPVAFANSLIAAITVTFFTLLTSAALGYIFAKYHFWGKEKLFLLLLSTMMVPFAVVLVPLYLTITSFGFANSLGGIIITGLWSAFGMFMLRQFMESIPFELIDAARIDGASDWGIYWRIGLPLARGALSVLAVLVFLGAWNDYLWPLIVLRSADKFTYPVGLATLVGLYKVEYGMILAGAFLATLPVVAIFVAGRKYLLENITIGAIKG